MYSGFFVFNKHILLITYGSWSDNSRQLPGSHIAYFAVKASEFQVAQQQDKRLIFIGLREGWTLEGRVWHAEKDGRIHMMPFH